MTPNESPLRQSPVARKPYTEADARRILEHAIAVQLHENAFSQEQLQTMAEELGISHESLARAEQTWLTEERTVPEQEGRAAFERHRQWIFRIHLAAFVLIYGFYFLPNPAIVFEEWGAFYLLLAGILSLVVHVSARNNREGPAYEQQFAAWRAERRLSESSKKRLRR